MSNFGYLRAHQALASQARSALQVFEIVAFADPTVKVYSKRVSPGPIVNVHTFAVKQRGRGLKPTCPRDRERSAARRRGTCGCALAGAVELANRA